MTKFLNESGFRRIIKTIKNALSLKADKSELPLLVTYDGTQCDTSIADIYAAFLAGRDVEMNYGYLFKLSLVQCSEGGAIFSANFSDQSIGIKGTISNGVDTWEFSLVDLQERLTSGTNIKTVAGNSLLGSGNVTLNDSDIYHSGEDGEDGNYIDDGDTVDVCLNNLDTAVASKQNTLVSGTNIKTVNHESVLGNGNINLNGSNIDTVVSDPNGDWVAGETIDDILVVKSQALADLEDKVDTGLNKRPIIVDYYHYADMIADSSQRGGTIAWEGDNECFYIYEITNEEWRRIDNEELNQITSITTTESTASGGNNTVTINTTDGTSKTFNVKNGKDGADGVSLGEVALVQTTGDSEESVMSQKAVTEYGRKVTAEDLNGTSDWIRAKLTEQGWEFGKYVASNGSLGTDANYCASFFIPMDMSIRKGHSITFGYMFNAWGNACLAWYNESKTFVSGLYYICNANNVRTITISTTDTWDNAAYIRMTCNPNRLNECYILDNTTGEYIFKGDEYLVPYNNNNNITYDFLENNVIAQELGNSATKVGSQKMITDSINYNTSIENAEGFTLNSNYTYRYIKLTSKATSLLNASDKMSFMFSTKGTGNEADYRYFRFGNGSVTANNVDATNGVYVGWSYSRNLSANGISYTLNQSGSNYPTPDVWIVTWDRVNGIVRFYDHTTLVNTLSGDSYKKDRFVNAEGKIAILGGNNNTRIYDIRLFDYDISYLFGNSDISSEINNLCGAGILPSQFLGNYESANNDSTYIDFVNNFQGGGYNTCTYTLDGDDYHIVVKDTTTTSQVCGGKPYYLGMPNKAQLEKIEFEVVSGVIKLCWRINMLEEGLNYYTIIDSNGNEISDYNNIGIGKYTLIRTQSSTGARFNFYKVSGNVEVVINRNMKYKPISCVFHLRGDTMYNKKFYDDQTNSFITIYTDHTCSVEYMEHTLVKTPQRVIRTEINNLNGLPHYAGEMAIASGNVYIGMPDYTWKQINNS